MMGAKIRKLRKAKKLTQEELARLINVSKMAVFSWEKEQYAPDGKNLVNLAKALDTSASYLLDEIDDARPSHEWALRGRNGEEIHHSWDEVLALPVYSPALTEAEEQEQQDSFSSTETIFFDRKEAGKTSETEPPYIVRFNSGGMEGYNIPCGAKCVVNPAERVRSGDIAYLKFGEDKMIKKVYWRRSGAEFRSSDGETILATGKDFESDWIRILGRVTAVLFKV